MTLEEPRFVNENELLFVGLAEHVPHRAMQNIPGQWARFMAGPYGEIGNKIGESPVGITTGSDNEGIEYVCAAGVTKFGTVPKGCIALTLPAATYAVFAHDRHIAQIRETYQAIRNSWFPKSGKSPAEAPSFERHNDTFDPRTGNGGVTIWIPVRT